MRAALDVAGQVYVLGTGTQGRFNYSVILECCASKLDQAAKVSHLDFEHFDRVLELWRQKLKQLDNEDLKGTIISENTAWLWARGIHQVGIRCNALSHELGRV